MNTKTLNKVIVFLIISLQMVFCTVSNSSCPNKRTSLSSIRKRRYLAFPDDSNLVLTISTVKAFMTHAPAGWNLVLEIDILYPLPSAKWIAEHSRKKHHRQKKDLWDRIKMALDEHNFNGEACVLRSICEAKYNLAPPGTSLVHDLLRAMLTAPTEEESFLQHLGGSYNQLSEPDFCQEPPDCPFSLLHFVLDYNKQRYSL